MGCPLHMFHSAHECIDGILHLQAACACVYGHPLPFLPTAQSGPRARWIVTVSSVPWEGGYTIRCSFNVNAEDVP